MTSLPYGLTSTRSTLWIWPQRRRTAWCRCVLGLLRSSSQGNNARWRSSGLPALTWLRSSKCALYLITGYVKLQKPTDSWSRSWLMLLMLHLMPSTKCTPNSQRWAFTTDRTKLYGFITACCLEFQAAVAPCGWADSKRNSFPFSHVSVTHIPIMPRRIKSQRENYCNLLVYSFGFFRT